VNRIDVVGDHQSVEIFAMMLIRITGSQLDAKSPEGPISGDRERNLCDLFDSRLVRAVPRVAVVRERGSLRVVATIEWGAIQFAIRCSVSVFVTHCRAQRGGCQQVREVPAARACSGYSLATFAERALLRRLRFRYRFPQRQVGFRPAIGALRVPDDVGISHANDSFCRIP
jgi:hypothetical protein